MKRWRIYLLAVSITAIIISPSEGLAIGPANVRLLDIAIGLLIFISVVQTKQFNVPFGIFELITPLLLIGIYSIFILPIQQFSILNSIIDLIELVEIILLFFILSHHFNELDKSHFELILRIIFILTAIGSVIAVFYYLITGSRFVGVPYIFGIPSFGIYYGFTYYIFRKNILTPILTAFILARVLLGNTRSVWIILPIPIIVIFILHWEELDEYLTKGLLIRILAFASTITVGIISVTPAVFSRFLSIIRGSQLLFARPVIYYSSIQILYDNPFGVGLGNFKTAIHEYAISGYMEYPPWFINFAKRNTINHMMGQFRDGNIGSHSDIFGFLMEIGVPGLVLFILFWIMGLRHVIRARVSPSQITLKLSILYVGLQSIINSSLLTGGGFYTVILFSLLLANDHT